MRLILLSTLLVLSLNCHAKKKGLVNLSNKGISDLSSLTIKEGTKRLRLDKNEITDLKGLRLPQSLEVLNLSDNTVKSFNGLVLTPNLQKLRIVRNEIDDIQDLKLPQSLLNLDLAVNSLDKDDLPNLNLNSNLEILDLSFNNIHDLSGLKLNSKLRELEIVSNQILNFDDTVLTDNLEVLNLAGTDIGNLEEVEFPLSLKKLILAVMQDVSFDQVNGIVLRAFLPDPRILKLPEGLEELDLDRDLIDSDVLDGWVLPPNLKKLFLLGNNLTNIDDLEIPESLELLDLRRNPIPKTERRRIRQRFKDRKNLRIRFKTPTKADCLFCI